MNKLIGFNLIMMVIWFVLSMIGCYKANNWDYFHSNWQILSLLTLILSTGVYFIFKK